MSNWLNLSDNDIKVITSKEDLFVVKANNTLIEIPDNATNGDVIKALFPNTKVDFHNPYGCIYWSEEISSPIYLGWWNAPYKEMKNDKRRSNSTN